MAIENARLYQSAKRWSRQLESLHEVMRSLVEEMELERLLELVCARLRELIGARVALISLATSPDGDLRIAAVDAEANAGASLIGYRLSRLESKSGRVLERRQSARVDSMLDDPEVDHEEARQLDARTGVFVPLIARGEAMGVIAVHDKLGPDARFSDEDLRLAEIFAARAAVAVSLSERVARNTLRRVVEAQELERRRLARELHDETGQALTSILLGVKAIRASGSPAEAEVAEAEVRAQIVQALQDVRALAVEAPACGTRRLRPRRRAGAPGGDLPGAERPRDDGAGEPRRPFAGRDRNRALSRRPGSADERDQARGCRARQHCSAKPRKFGRGDDR